jgi:uncharacterized protein (UPF0262 family)
MTEATTNRLIAVELDQTLGKGSASAEHDRQIAIHDLLEANTFSLSNGISGPYRLRFSSVDGRLVFAFLDAGENTVYTIALSLAPFRRVVKDYFGICDSYDKAVRNATPAQIETIDMARRAIHNEGSELLMERLAGKAETDFDTARRLFTLICALMWQG